MVVLEIQIGSLRAPALRPHVRGAQSLTRPFSLRALPRRPGPPGRAPRVSIGRTPLTASAVSQPASTVESNPDIIAFPLDYYRILGVTRASSKDAVDRAYQRLSNSPPQHEYSNQVWS